MPRNKTHAFMILSSLAAMPLAAMPNWAKLSPSVRAACEARVMAKAIAKRERRAERHAAIQRNQIAKAISALAQVGAKWTHFDDHPSVIRIRERLNLRPVGGA